MLRCSHDVRALGALPEQQLSSHLSAPASIFSDDPVRAGIRSHFLHRKIAHPVTPVPFCDLLEKEVLQGTDASSGRPSTPQSLCECNRPNLAPWAPRKGDAWVKYPARPWPGSCVAQVLTVPAWSGQPGGETQRRDVRSAAALPPLPKACSALATASLCILVTISGSWYNSLGARHPLPTA